MSLKIVDALKLPCLRQARVAGGKGGLERVVGMVSVLEYSVADDLQAYICNAMEPPNGELVLSCFAGARDDVDEQCRTIKRLAAIGEVGLVLFYVGIVMKRVDGRLTELADELGFPLIIMPENNEKLRYSEVIGDVMFAVFQDQMSVTQFKDDILERISRLPFYRRSVDAVLRLLSDRVKASLFVTDASGSLLSMACYPRSLEIDAEAAVRSRAFSAHRSVNTAQGARLNLYAMRPDAAMDDDEAGQIADVLRLAVNMWSSGTEMALPELIKAIMQDEPIKMRRIAAAFNIDVASIRSLLLITPEGGGVAAFERVLAILRRELARECKTFVADIYNQDVVACTDTPSHGDLLSIAAELTKTLAAEGAPAVAAIAADLTDTAQVRGVYLAIQSALATARRIYPARRVFTRHDADFAEECRAVLERGEDAARRCADALNPLQTDDAAFSADLLETLTVYLLDSDGSRADCAARLFVHQNSVKYRLKRAGELLGFKVGHMPETMALYRAAALKRLLVVKKDN